MENYENFPPQEVMDSWALEAYEEEMMEEQYAAELFQEWADYSCAREMGWE